MWTDGKKSMINKNRTFAKIAEIFFASGIPVLALADNSPNPGKFFSSLPVLLLIILIGGWHIKTFNDDCEDGKIFSIEAFIPLILLPLVFCFRPIAGLILLLIIANWDFYSKTGKDNYLISMAANFSGGFLHFTLGSLCAEGAEMNNRLSPKALFFAFAMLSGSMHHDAYHAPEDEKKHFCTGAVKFGADTWWKIAVFPMIYSFFFLFQSEKNFFEPFLFLGLLPYFIFYLIIFALSDNPPKFTLFRTVCRLTFALAAIIFIIRKFQSV